MFTGLIEDIGTVVRLSPGAMTELQIRTSLGAATFALGESIAVNGACLTVVARTGDVFRVQAAPETLRRTTLGALREGAPVNLERALALGARLGGHLVSGHVDAVTRVLRVFSEGGSRVMHFALPSELAPFFIEKGSVTLDGVSLTVNALGGRGTGPAGQAEVDFQVQLIPETQKRTTLGARQVGELVNVEADLIGKYVARMWGLRAAGDAAGGSMSEAALRAAGFGAK